MHRVACKWTNDLLTTGYVEHSLLVVLQLIKLAACYGTQRCITVFIRACCPYPKPYQSSPCPPPLHLCTHHPISRRSMWSLSRRFHTKTMYAHLLSLFVPYAAPIWVFLIGLPKYCLFRSTDLEVPHYVVSFSPLKTLSLLGPNIFISTLLSKHHQPLFLKNVEVTQMPVIVMAVDRLGNLCIV